MLVRRMHFRLHSPSRCKSPRRLARVSSLSTNAPHRLHSRYFMFFPFSSDVGPAYTAGPNSPLGIEASRPHSTARGEG